MAAEYNPLHAYRSYVPHYALVALKGTTAAFQFFETDANTKSGMNLYLHPPGGRENKYKAQGKNNDYVVIFNSTTDAEFYIDKLDISSVMQQQGKQVAKGFNIHATTISMSIKLIEPFTVDFISAQLTAKNNLGIDNWQEMHYLLKIFFVGYKDDDSVDVISLVAPIEFSIALITLSLTHAGSEYIITCLPIAGAGHDTTFNNIGGITMQTAGSVSATIDKLNAKLAERTNNKELNIKSNNPSIKYKVFLDPVYKDPKYTINNMTPDQLNNYLGVKTAANVQFITAKSDTITDTITNIMLLSNAVVAELTPNPEPGPGELAPTYVHKIHSTSAVVDNELTYYYYIIRHTVNVMGISAPNTNNASVDTNPLIDAAKLNVSYIEYDYIYTGKNVDILQYIMTIPMFGDGSPFTLFQTSTTGTSVGQTKLASDQQIPEIANKVVKAGHNDNELTITRYNGATQPDKVSERSSVPMTTVDQSNVGRGAANAALFYKGRQALSNFVSNTNISAVIEIVGNPLILNTIMLPGPVFLDNQGVGVSAQTAKQNLEDRKKLGTLGGSPLTMPLVKINVRIPKPTYAQGGVYGGESPDYENKFSTSFWNNNCYTIMIVDHVFEKNKFIQRLKLNLYLPPRSGSVDLISASSSGNTSNDSNVTPTNTLPSNLSTKDTNARRQYVYNGLLKRHFSSVHASAIVGNIAVENPTFDPAVHQKGGPAYGLCQWEGSRRTDLQNFAASQGKPESDMDVQLDFIRHELSPTGTHASAYKLLMKTTDVSSATYVVTASYEKPKGASGGVIKNPGPMQYNKRVASAEQIYNQQKDA